MWGHVGREVEIGDSRGGYHVAVTGSSKSLVTIQR